MYIYNPYSKQKTNGLAILLNLFFEFVAYATLDTSFARYMHVRVSHETFHWRASLFRKINKFCHKDRAGKKQQLIDDCSSLNSQLPRARATCRRDYH